MTRTSDVSEDPAGAGISPDPGSVPDSIEASDAVEPSDSIEASDAVETTDPIEEDVSGFPIVAIGASAGGLAAVETFFGAMPPDRDPGMAFVLVQHLSPDHNSVLTELVGRTTRMKVFEVKDGVEVKANCVYVIPPNRDLVLEGSRLWLREPGAARGHRLPIDVFFRSLAKERRERAVCIVLSGTGSDGTAGLRAVKHEGGMAIAQDPTSTEYPGMPKSAIATGLVDFILPPAHMPDQLIAYAEHAFQEGTAPQEGSPTLVESDPESPDSLGKIFFLVRSETGHDFSNYKSTTIHRRIQRRMALHQLGSLEEYVHFLETSPGEVQGLFQDLLIGVTRFFRDPEAFESLSLALSDLVSEKRSGETIRVWVPGCSTGEEAYSVAILLQEKVEEAKKNLGVQIFATDIDSRAIQVARAGIYPTSIEPDVSEERLDRYFLEAESGEPHFRIRKDVRDMLVFSEQDVIRDPPFSKLDLISCRNLLIYISAKLQKKLIPLFHFALNPGGLLFLGTSESVGEFGDLFVPLDRRASLYCREELASGRGGMGPAPYPLTRFLNRPRAAPSEGAPARLRLPLKQLAQDTLLAEINAVGALVGEDGRILYLHGRPGPYLEPAQGEGTMDILKMAREGLDRELAIALHRATTQNARVDCSGVRVKSNGGSVTVDLVVRPVAGTPGDDADSPLFLVILRPVPAPLEGTAPDLAEEENLDEHSALAARIGMLERELQAKEEYLRTIQEEMRGSHEQLRTSIEELQSTNEELQSSNEEMETSKEELGSLNEELSTVNTELESRLADLSRSHNDMNNLLAGTGIATIFLDLQLRIQRFTPSAVQLMNLIEADVGRPVGDLTSRLKGYDSLVSDTKSVLDTLEPREIEVRTGDDEWYLLSIRPYRTVDNVIEGAVVTFTEVTKIKKAEAALQQTQGIRRLAAVVRDSRDAIIAQDLRGRIQAWNPAATRMYGWEEAQALEMNYLELLPEGERDRTRLMFEELPDARAPEPVRSWRVTRDGTTVQVDLSMTLLVDETGRPYAISTTERLLESDPPESG